MKDKFDDRYYLERIVWHCGNIQDFTDRFHGSLKVLMSDLAYLQSVVLSIEQIGENAKKLSDVLTDKYDKEYWHNVCKTRDKLTHHYDGIDIALVWEIITVDIPKLKSCCEKILTEI